MGESCELGAARLRCEGLEDPLGIDVMKPRLSWVLEPAKPGLRNLRQTAYQIVVGNSLEDLRAGAAGVWHSGKVDSPDSAHVLDIGRPFLSGARCCWKIRVWDRNGEVSGYSEAAFFEFGLLEASDWQGSWIGAEKGVSAPLLRKTFFLDGPVDSARLYIAGLGYHELYVNGSKVGDRVLDPAMTYYSDLNTLGLRARVLYVTHDVTEHLLTGDNVIGVVLGHGWYSVESDTETCPDRHARFGDRQRLLLQLNLKRGSGSTESISTDRTWRVSDSAIRYNDFVHGEVYDARLEKTGWCETGFDDTSWSTARKMEAPDGRLEAQMMPPERVVETMAPTAISNNRDGSCVFDFGVNFTGWARLRVTGPRGTEVTLAHTQTLMEDGSLDRMAVYSVRRH